MVGRMNVVCSVIPKRKELTSIRDNPRTDSEERKHIKARQRSESRGLTSQPLNKCKAHGQGEGRTGYAEPSGDSADSKKETYARKHPCYRQKINQTFNIFSHIASDTQ
jgi:hypothetical protein